MYKLQGRWNGREWFDCEDHHKIIENNNYRKITRAFEDWVFYRSNCSFRIVDSSGRTTRMYSPYFWEKSWENISVDWLKEGF